MIFNDFIRSAVLSPLSCLSCLSYLSPFSHFISQSSQPFSAQSLSPQPPCKFTELKTRIHSTIP